MAPECTLVAKLQTLVHILADLIHPRSESFVAGALEAAVDVRAGPVTANVLIGEALVVVDATSATGIQDVARGTLAPEGTVGVYALAAGTGVWHEEALVQVDPRVVPAWSLRAEPFELLWTRWKVTLYQFQLFNIDGRIRNLLNRVFDLERCSVSSVA